MICQHPPLTEERDLASPWIVVQLTATALLCELGHQWKTTRKQGCQLPAPGLSLAPAQPLLSLPGRCVLVVSWLQNQEHGKPIPDPVPCDSKHDVDTHRRFCQNVASSELELTGGIA
jgi:hypothetical protein